MSKVKVAVVTDSTCNLSAELIEQNNLHVIPQIVNWDEDTLLDGVDIFPDAFYKRLASSKTLPTTSQPSAGEFVEFFSKVKETADSIVAVCISDELSGTLDSARTAAGMMGDYPIEIVDSRLTTMGLGFVALAAARAAAQGKSYTEVADAARSVAPHVRVVFVVDTLEYLHKGGRIGGARRLVGSMLSIKPLLHLQDGRIEPLASIRTKKKAVNHMLSTVAKEVGHKPLHAAIINANAAQEAEKIFNTVKEQFKTVELFNAELSPVIGTHVGPGTVGIAYYADEG